MQIMKFKKKILIFWQISTSNHLKKVSFGPSISHNVQIAQISKIEIVHGFLFFNHAKIGKWIKCHTLHYLKWKNHPRIC